MTWVSGVTGPGAASVNGAWKIHVIDFNTVELHPFVDSGPQQASGPAGGGTISLNRFQLEPVTEGTTLPATCTYGTWWHKQADVGSEDEYHRTWYCNDANATLSVRGPLRGPSRPAGEWVPYRMDPYANSTPFPPIDLATNRAHHLMFQGLSFEPLALKADLQRAQYMYVPSNYQTGTMFWTFVGQTRYNNHIYWNQILAQCPDPSPNGSMVRCHAFANPLDGSHIAVQQSYFSGFQIFHSPQDLDDGNAVVLAVNHGPGPHAFTNNHIECAGICVYYHDDSATTSNATDLTFTGNVVITPDRYWDQSPSWLGPHFSTPLYWSRRHQLELKRLQRGIISGNTFLGGWVWINNGAAICLCTRGGAAGAQISGFDGTTVTTYDATISGDWGIEAYTPGDRVYLVNLSGGNCQANPAQVFTVSNVINSYTVSLSPSLGCNATRGNIVRLASSAYISDVSVTNNVISSTPTGVFLLGHDSYGGSAGLPTTAMQRISISNNLVINLDGSRVGAGNFLAVPGSAPAGTFVVPIYGMEDLTVSHNTVYMRTMAAFMNSDSSLGGPSSGLSLKANIFESVAGYAIENSSTYYGSAALAHSWVSGSAPQYVAAYNVILRSGGASGSPFDPSVPPYGPYPQLTKWFDTNSGPFPFKDPASGDFSLGSLYRSTDTCYAVPRDCTDDGTDVGVNTNLLPPVLLDGTLNLFGSLRPSDPARFWAQRRPASRRSAIGPRNAGQSGGGIQASCRDLQVCASR